MDKGLEGPKSHDITPGNDARVTMAGTRLEAAAAAMGGGGREHWGGTALSKAEQDRLRSKNAAQNIMHRSHKTSVWPLPSPLSHYVPTMLRTTSS